MCGEILVAGISPGVLLGGCLTLVQTTLGTPWEIDTRGAILLLEDRGVKPYQVDRMLVQLGAGGKVSQAFAASFWASFPIATLPVGSDVTVREVCRRILGASAFPSSSAQPSGTHLAQCTRFR